MLLDIEIQTFLQEKIKQEVLSSQRPGGPSGPVMALNPAPMGVRGEVEVRFLVSPLIEARMLLKVQEITVEKAVTSDKQEALSHQLSANSQGMG
jgi:hypothetical protein